MTPKETECGYYGDLEMDDVLYLFWALVHHLVTSRLARARPISTSDYRKQHQRIGTVPTIGMNAFDANSHDSSRYATVLIQNTKTRVRR
jgi:hypothetical protein